MKRKILQSMADFAVKQLTKANSEQEIKAAYDFGMWIDRLAINYFDIYLD